ncbi:hypothetical protein BCR35DRAFT_324934 [Leucosporidium creatinivorum]|uniref:F-box domain-containing protein n=1 Tax=Leucosporidium creatinivorum TaxID=106004 RepID=A0A1Y2FGA4_9BASI|nr:hypothetical protein BCR35DRAFT_324934 [Leucosporidium creatinivorum]
MTSAPYPISIIHRIVQLAVLDMVNEERWSETLPEKSHLPHFLTNVARVHASFRPIAERLLLNHVLVTGENQHAMKSKARQLSHEDRMAIKSLRVSATAEDWWSWELKPGDQPQRDNPMGPTHQSLATAHMLDTLLEELPGVTEVEVLHTTLHGLRNWLPADGRIQHLRFSRSTPTFGPEDDSDIYDHAPKRRQPKLPPTRIPRVTFLGIVDDDEPWHTNTFICMFLLTKHMPTEALRFVEFAEKGVYRALSLPKKQLPVSSLKELHMHVEDEHNHRDSAQPPAVWEHFESLTKLVGPLTLLPSTAEAAPLPPTLTHLNVLPSPLSPDGSISGYTLHEARLMLFGAVRSLPALRELVVEERICSAELEQECRVKGVTLSRRL